ncbi:MAG TPA: hypothetical protein VMW65_16825 [Chloroflexota bacterium]|nr:hypothetical protein [Chloroflexota bacterium]
MCDGLIEEYVWTIQQRSTGEPLETEGGYQYIFSDESDALVFLGKRSDAAGLEVVAIRNESLD